MTLRLTDDQARALGIRERKDGTAVIERSSATVAPAALRTKPVAALVEKPQRSKGSPPQERLWAAVYAVYGERAVWEFKGAVPGRRFRCDIAIPDRSLLLEIDGWRHHGKTLSAFKSDRRKQNLLAKHGWYVLRFFRAEIYDSIDKCLAIIAETCENGFAQRAASHRAELQRISTISS